MATTIHTQIGAEFEALFPVDEDEDVNYAVENIQREMASGVAAERPDWQEDWNQETRL